MKKTRKERRLAEIDKTIGNAEILIEQTLNRLGLTKLQFNLIKGARHDN